MKFRDIKKMSKEERTKKIDELKLELVKTKANPSKSPAKTKEIKKTIARILTLNNQENKTSKVGGNI